MDELLKGGVMEEEIGIITPYNSQANLIQSVFSKTSVEIHTIDKYQVLRVLALDVLDMNCRSLLHGLRIEKIPANCSCKWE